MLKCHSGFTFHTPFMICLSPHLCGPACLHLSDFQAVEQFVSLCWSVGLISGYERLCLKTTRVPLHCHHPLQKTQGWTGTAKAGARGEVEGGRLLQLAPFAISHQLCALFWLGKMTVSVCFKLWITLQRESVFGGMRDRKSAPKHSCHWCCMLFFSSASSWYPSVMVSACPYRSRFYDAILIVGGMFLVPWNGILFSFCLLNFFLSFFNVLVDLWKPLCLSWSLRFGWSVAIPLSPDLCVLVDLWQLP